MMTSKKFFSKVTEPIDQWLESQGLYRKHTAHDPSCLFRAVAEQIFFSQCAHELVRKQCVEFLQRHQMFFEKQVDESFDNYISEMASSKGWGSNLELNAISQLYEREVIVFEQGEKPTRVAINSIYKKSIMLCASSDNHYDSVYPKSYIMKAAFCQSLVYEILYKKVFNLLDVDYAVEKMLHKSGHNKREHFIHQNYICTSSMGLTLELPMKALRYLEPERYEGELNVRELLARGITPFPYKVAKALDPDIYRNIEFDVWSDLRRELKLGIVGGNSDELQIGVKCLVKLQPDRVFHAHIQEMEPNNGPVIVFVEELGEKCTVSHDVLEPLPKNQKVQWPIPYRQQHHFSPVSSKTPLLTLSDFNSKWRKNKYNKTRKLKDLFMPYSFSPSLHCPAVGHSSSFQQDPHSNQMHYPEFLGEDCSYNNNGSGRNDDDHSSPIQFPQSENNVINNGNGASPPGASSSPPSAPPKTSPLESDQQHGNTTCSPPVHVVGIPAYSSMCPDSSVMSRGPSSPAVPSYGTTQSRMHHVSGGLDNYAYQPVNFFAPKSVQLNGSDLPFSDIPTLRFYYNLGHDFFRSGFMWWSNAFPTHMPPPPPPPSPVSGENSPQVLSDSTASPEEDLYSPPCGQNVQPVQIHQQQQQQQQQAQPSSVHQPVHQTVHQPMPMLSQQTVLQAVPPPPSPMLQPTSQQTSQVASQPIAIPVQPSHQQNHSSPPTLPHMMPQMNVNAGWHHVHSSSIHGNPNKTVHDCEAGRSANHTHCEEYAGARTNEPNGSNPCHSNIAVHPSMVEAYNNTPVFPYYVVEMDSVPYYNVGAPYSYVIHPSSDMEMMQLPQVQPMQQPPVPSGSPVVYHQPTVPVPHWITPTEAVSQCTIAM